MESIKHDVNQSVNETQRMIDAVGKKSIRWSAVLISSLSVFLYKYGRKNLGSSIRLAAKDGKTKSLRSQAGLTREEAQHLIGKCRAMGIETALIPADEQGNRIPTPFGYELPLSRFAQGKFARNHIQYSIHEQKAMETGSRLMSRWHHRQMNRFQQTIRQQPASRQEFYIVQYNTDHMQTVLPILESMEQNRRTRTIQNTRHRPDIQNADNPFQNLTRDTIEPNLNYGTQTMSNLQNTIKMTITKEAFLNSVGPVHETGIPCRIEEDGSDTMNITFPTAEKDNIFSLLKMSEENAEYIEFGSTGFPKSGMDVQEFTISEEDFSKAREMFKGLDYFSSKKGNERTIFMTSDSFEAIPFPKKKNPQPSLDSSKTGPNLSKALSKDFPRSYAPKHAAKTPQPASKTASLSDPSLSISR